MNTWEYGFIDNYGNQVEPTPKVCISHGITFDDYGHILMHSIEYWNSFDRLDIVM